MADLQQVLAVSGVLLALVTSLYVLSRKGMVRFTMLGKFTSDTRRMQAIERLTLTAQHSLHLVKVSGRELLILVSPTGCSIVDSYPPAAGSHQDGSLL